MTPEEYFKQRLSPADFEKRGFTKADSLYDDDYHYGKRIGHWHVIISYPGDENDAICSIFIVHDRDKFWSGSEKILVQSSVYTPEELDFILNRSWRYQTILGKTMPWDTHTQDHSNDWKPVLPACPPGIEITYFKEDGITPSMTQRGCCGPINIWATNEEPWGEKLPLGGFYVSCPVPKEPVDDTASVSSSIWVRNQAPTCWDSQPTKTGLRTTFKPVYPGVWPWIKRLFGIYTP